MVLARTPRVHPERRQLGAIVHWSGREGNKTAEGQTYFTLPIEVIVSELETAKSDLASIQLPSLSVSDTGQTTYSFIKTASEKVVDSILAKRAAKAAIVSRWTHVVACLRGTIQYWLAKVAVQLRYGTLVENAFERARAAFDERLAEQAPDVAKKLASAYQRASSDDPEEWSQALTSCRRALKSLADCVYPPSKQKIQRTSVDRW